MLGELRSDRPEIIVPQCRRASLPMGELATVCQAQEGEGGREGEREREREP